MNFYVMMGYLMVICVEKDEKMMGKELKFIRMFFINGFRGEEECVVLCICGVYFELFW